MARTLAGLYAAGATLALLTVALPHSAHASDADLLAIVGIAYVVAGALFWRAGTVPAWMLRIALAWGSTLITGVAYFSAQSPSPLVFFYLWVFLYSAYFFTTREMVAQIAYVGIAYAALLIGATAVERGRRVVAGRHGHPARRRDPDPRDARTGGAVDRKALRRRPHGPSDGADRTAAPFASCSTSSSSERVAARAS